MGLAQEMRAPQKYDTIGVLLICFLAVSDFTSVTIAHREIWVPVSVYK